MGGLALVVAVRSLLGFTLEMELTDHWPWRGGGEDEGGDERTGQTKHRRHA